MADFYTLLTNVGKAKIANAWHLGQSVALAELAAGDGNGEYYNPSESQLALVNEVWRGTINEISIDPENLNWLVVEAVIPTEVGGFYIREVGVFDEDGDMIAVGKYPETYKPELPEGSAKDLYIRMILEIENVEAVELKIDPAIVLASRSYVDAAVAAAVGNVTDHHHTGVGSMPTKVLLTDGAEVQGVLPAAHIGAHQHTQAQSHDSPDTDTSETALHHTLGTGEHQAAAGNHSHVPAALAGSYVECSAPTERNVTSGTYAKVKEIYIARAGTYTVSFTLRNADQQLSYAQVWKNGAPVGTERSTGETATYSEDLTFAAGDLVQLYAYTQGPSGTYVSAFAVKTANPVITTLVLD